MNMLFEIDFETFEWLTVKKKMIFNMFSSSVKTKTILTSV